MDGHRDLSFYLFLEDGASRSGGSGTVSASLRNGWWAAVHRNGLGPIQLVIVIVAVAALFPPIRVRLGGRIHREVSSLVGPVRLFLSYPSLSL